MDRSVVLLVVLGIAAPGLAGCTAQAEVHAVAPPPPRAEVVVAAQPAPPVQREVVVERPAPPVAEVVVATPPPAPPVVVEPPAPPAPGPDYFWIAGYHRWNGHAYIWEKGRYERRPRPAANWVPARWEPRANGHVWVEGHWG